MRKVRWLLACAGDIVKSRVASALSMAENSEIAAIFAPSEGKAESIAEQYNIPKVYHDYSKALSESVADSVYIATPHRYHVSMANDALKQGKHFLSEKSLGINSRESLELLELVRRSSLKTVYFNYRFFTSQFKTTWQIIQSGEIGNLVCGQDHDEEPYYNPSNAPLLKKNGKSPIFGFGFYLINMAQKLFGCPAYEFY